MLWATNKMNINMKKVFLILIFIICSNHLFSQDTIWNIDGTFEIIPSFEKMLNHSILYKINELKFIDFDKNNLVIDTNNLKPIVINIWAIWCHPCVVEIPTFNNLLEKYKNCNVDFYGLSFTEDSVNTLNFLKKHSYNFKQVYANRDYINKSGIINGLPTTLFIDKQGNVLYKIVGGSEEPELQEETIKKFIEGMKTIGCP